MSRADEIASDLKGVLSTFSTAEQKLALAEARMQKKSVVSITVDTYESLPFPVVRHIFYGLNEKQAKGFLKSHRKTDEFFKQCASGRWKDVECRNSRPVIRKVSREKIAAAGGPPPKTKKTLAGALRGTGIG